MKSQYSLSKMNNNNLLYIQNKIKIHIRNIKKLKQNIVLYENIKNITKNVKQLYV